MWKVLLMLWNWLPGEEEVIQAARRSSGSIGMKVCVHVTEAQQLLSCYVSYHVPFSVESEFLVMH